PVCYGITLRDTTQRRKLEWSGSKIRELRVISTRCCSHSTLQTPSEKQYTKSPPQRTPSRPTAHGLCNDCSTHYNSTSSQFPQQTLPRHLGGIHDKSSSNRTSKSCQES